MTAALASPTRGELPATATYHHRAWQWLPDARPDRDGTLCIQLTTGRRQPTTEFHWYAVQIDWDECDADAGVWVFLLENEREPDELGPIVCVVGGMQETCSCEAGGFDRVRHRPTSCKHRDSLAAIVKEVM